MQARDVMTTNVVIVQTDTPISEIARILSVLGISGVPVMEGDTLVGIVKEVDLIARHARPHYPRYLPLLDAQIPLGGQREYQEIVRRILGTTAHDIMSAPVKTCHPDDDLEEVATLMVEKNANPIPVMDHGRLVGIISHTDLLTAFSKLETAPEDSAA